jgi:hypothetical protein
LYPFISLTETKLCKCIDFLHPTRCFPSQTWQIDSFTLTRWAR